MATADIETARLPRLRSADPVLTQSMAALTSALPAQPFAAGRELWKRAIKHSERLSDDRILYWARLAVKHSLAQQTVDEEGLKQFERASRGFEDFAYDPASVRVLVTGFDPFHLDANILQSNPSGLAVTLLHDRRLLLAPDHSASPLRAHIRGAIMPVRFRDFDHGIVEDLVEPLLISGAIDLLVTLSMGRDGFDLERFPGLRRSAAVSDNLNVLTGANERAPRIPHLRGAVLDGPEFLEFSLPADRLVSTGGRWAIRDNRDVATLAGERQAVSLETLADQIAVRGSGGGYLSNEIAYRCLRLRGRVESRIRMGHVHTPALVGFDQQKELAMVKQIVEIVRVAAGSVHD